MEIIDYKPSLRHHFAKLNKEWLERYFAIEEVDKKIFNNPEHAILDQPGFIIFAKVDEDIVGTGAVVNCGTKWELIKMAVTEQYQGQGIGEIIARTLLKKARDAGAENIFIVSNTKLKSAIKLYTKIGFKVVLQGPHPKYDRGNILLELNKLALNLI